MHFPRRHNKKCVSLTLAHFFISTPAATALIDADALVILSDIDGLFDANPTENPDAKLIAVVEKIDESIFAICGSAGTARGTGGMVTKVHAAQIAGAAGIPTVVMNGSSPQDLYKLIDGHRVGTIFLPEKK